jgi:hypothetical protein
MKKQAFVNLPLSQTYDAKMSDEDIKSAFILLIEEMFEVYDIEKEDIHINIVDLKVE